MFTPFVLPPLFPSLHPPIGRLSLSNLPSEFLSPFHLPSLLTSLYLHFSLTCRISFLFSLPYFPLPPFILHLSHFPPFPSLFLSISLFIHLATHSFNYLFPLASSLPACVLLLYFVSHKSSQTGRDSIIPTLETYFMNFGFIQFYGRAEEDGGNISVRRKQ